MSQSDVVGWRQHVRLNRNQPDAARDVLRRRSPSKRRSWMAIVGGSDLRRTVYIKGRYIAVGLFRELLPSLGLVPSCGSGPWRALFGVKFLKSESSHRVHQREDDAGRDHARQDDLVAVFSVRDLGHEVFHLRELLRQHAHS